MPMQRRRILRLWRIAAVIGAALGLVLVVWFDNEANRGVVRVPRGAPVRWADVPQLGVNLHNIQYEPDPAVVTRTLLAAQALGARTVRLQLPWDDVEIHGKGDFVDRRHAPARDAWEKYDFIIAEARRLGLEPQVRIDRAPDWARPNDRREPRFVAGLAENPDSTGPPERYADYADFVGAVAARYRGQVRFIQLWNEPNLAYEWSWRIPEPERFAELLRLAAAAARAANPQVVILFPSLSPTDGKEPRLAPMSELEYLDRVYRAGAADDFDIMSAQAYGLGQPPDENRYVRLRWHPSRPFTDLERPIDSRIDVSRVVLLRELMERHGDAAKAVWVSEFGYNSAPARVPEPARSTWGPPVDEQRKAAWLVAQLERARREWPWMGVMHVWMLRWGGEPPDPANPTPYFAVLQQDFTPLPAYGALAAYAAAPAWLGAGVHASGHPAFRPADGGWQFTFEGTYLALGRRVAPLTVRLAGGAAQQISAGDAPVVVAQGLADGRHDVTLLGAALPATVLVGRDAIVAERGWPALAALALGALMLATAWLAAGGRDDA